MFPRADPLPLLTTVRSPPVRSPLG